MIDFTRQQEARKVGIGLLEVPAALPVFLGGLRIGAALAVIGAVVGEFVGADRGLERDVPSLALPAPPDEEQRAVALLHDKAPRQTAGGFAKGPVRVLVTASGQVPE